MQMHMSYARSHTDQIDFGQVLEVLSYAVLRDFSIILRGNDP